VFHPVVDIKLNSYAQYDAGTSTGGAGSIYFLYMTDQPINPLY